MQKHIYYIPAAFIIGIFAAQTAAAKVWLLPDYQAKQFYSNRTSSSKDTSSPSDSGSVSCRTYGMLSASELGNGMVCQNSSRIRDMVCYSDCSCAPEYQYTESSCRSAGKIAFGSSCDGKYTKCICDTSLYPHTSSSCVPSLSGASCVDDSGTHYENCVTDPCAGKEIVTCGKALGCAETCDAGGSKCIRCNEQPDCGDGKYWAGDDLGCVVNVCPVDYAADAADCGLAVSNSHWELGSQTNGKSGTQSCYNCLQVCDSGYADYDTYWCGGSPATTSCSSLGYKKSVSCSSGTVVRCPFDRNYAVCLGQMI